jgi:hypothetical protein
MKLTNTVIRPKFNNEPNFDTPCLDFLRIMSPSGCILSSVEQKDICLNIFSLALKKFKLGVIMTFYDMLELDPCLSKIGFEKCDYTAFFLYEGSIFWGSSQ